jgi:hypothetical protein
MRVYVAGGLCHAQLRCPQEVQGRVYVAADVLNNHQTTADGHQALKCTHVQQAELSGAADC